MSEETKRPGAANKRESGARKYPWSHDENGETDQNAAKNRPDEPYGLTEPVNRTSEDTVQSDSVDPPRRGRKA